MIVKIKNICDTISETFDFNQPEIHFLNTGDILEGHIINDLIYKKEELKGQAKKSIKNNDILFSEIRPKNKHYAIVNLKHPEKYVVSTKLMVIRIKSKVNINLKYFYYCITNENFLNKLQRKAENRIGSFPQITFEVLSNFELDLPPRHIQDKIAEILSNIDNQIERNNCMVKRLQDLATSTYSRWFNQFEFPNEDGLPYKSNGGKFIYNEELKRNIPIGWKVKCVGGKDGITKCVLGGTPSRDNLEYWNGKINWINSGEVANFPIISTIEKITEKGLNSSATELMNKGSIVISITGNIRFSINALDCCANQSVVGVYETNDFKNSFLYFALNNQEKMYINKMTGAIQKHINKEVVETTKLLIPPQDILNNYYLIAQPFIEQIINISNKTLQLNNLKSKLLSLLINGQLEV